MEINIRKKIITKLIGLIRINNTSILPNKKKKLELKSIDVSIDQYINSKLL